MGMKVETNALSYWGEDITEKHIFSPDAIYFGNFFYWNIPFEKICGLKFVSILLHYMLPVWFVMQVFTKMLAYELINDVKAPELISWFP